MMESSGKIKVRQAKTGDLKKMQEFFKKVYGPGHIFTNLKHLRWNFGNWYKNKLTLSAVIAENASKNIVGFLGAVSVCMCIAGKRYKCGWYANWITSKEMRGKGIGMRIFHKVTDSYELPLAVSFSNIAYPIYPKNGWEKIGQYTRLITIIDPKNAISVARLIYPQKNANILKNKKYLFSAEILKNNNTNLRIKWEKPKERPWNTAWPAIKERFAMTTDRPWRHLVWRFFKHPFVKYHFATAYDSSGNIKGLAVVRIEKAGEFSIARIVDIVSFPETDAPLIQEVIKFARKNKCIAVDTYLTFKQYIDIFKKLGFRNGRRWPLYLVPELFNPLAQYSLNPIRWAMCAKLNKIPKNNFPPVSERHFVKANGDRDRA